MANENNNPEFELAVKFVTQTARPIFLTGRAGTGKTTFLKWVRENSFKKMAVVAPTGVAAINAGGTTLHSFFQLPFGPFLPTAQSEGWGLEHSGFTNLNSLFRNIRFNASKKELLQELDLLIIDEISMVRADTLDAVDAVLRQFRQQPLAPFGGLQVLYIGDLYQLPPVVSNQEWELLKPYYSSPFFFDAQVMRQAPPVYLELQKIYRQKEERFIGLLNNIRHNKASWEDLEKLHDLYQPEFVPSKGDNYITLTSHNARADGINQEELGKLRGSGHVFEATVTGEFNDKAYPAEKRLVLKEGAQVMLIKNDKGETRRYYNGKLGVIKKMADDRLTLAFPDEVEELVLEKETWKNIRYAFNREKDEIEEEELGSFRQYPIRLAWAITIHKSQGLTFEKAVIDAGGSFAPGQVYVALSRLTGLKGLVLRSRITPAAISTDPRVVAWTEGQVDVSKTSAQLEQDQLAFIGDSLRAVFLWSRLAEQFRGHYTGYAHRKIPEREKAVLLGRQWLDKVVLQDETAQKFSRQLEQLLNGAERDGYRQLGQRVEAAVTFFVGALENELIMPLQAHITDLRIKKGVKKYLQEVQAVKQLCVRKKQQVEDVLQLVRGLQKGVDTGKLLTGWQEGRKKKEAVLAAGEVSRGSGVGRDSGTGGGSRTGGDSGADGDSGTGGASGVGRGAGGGKSSGAGKPQKGESNRISLGLHKEGVSITDIAIQRGLSVSTVEGHLASFIGTGEIGIGELVPKHKIEPIATAIKELGGAALGPIRGRLGDGYSFGEIKAVLVYLKHAEPAG